jgi:hypothetical protein
MKSRIVFIIIALIVLSSLSGCATKKDQNVAKILGKMLSTDNIGYTKIRVGGDKITVYYEASTASSYDEQIVSDWATIFGAASNFDYEDVVIINAVNNEPYAKLTTTRENILSLINSDINEYGFFENVEIKALS